MKRGILTFYFGALYMSATFLALLTSSANSPNTRGRSTPFQVPPPHIQAGHVPRDSAIDLGTPARLPGFLLKKPFHLVLKVFSSEVEHFLQTSTSFFTNRGDDVGRMTGRPFLIAVV